MDVYLDYAATTPLNERVLEAMLPYLREGFANPSSLHTYGQRARRAVEEARERVAAAINASPREIIFTSGATEADNHALRSSVRGKLQAHILSSALEHSAVLSTCRALEKEGQPLTYLKPNERGEITVEAVKAALRDDTALVALMLVNNETGVISDIQAIGRKVRKHGALMFTDAVQAFGVLPLDVKSLSVDLLSLSAHKAYGPKGVGILYVRHPLELPPFMLGGEQERGLRAGTLNVPAIVGMGVTAELVQERLERDALDIAAKRDYLQGRLAGLEGVRINTLEAPRSPKHLSVTVPGVDGEALLMNLDRAGVFASAGSACAAGSIEPSHVLTAMGLGYDEAKATVRFSLGRGLAYEALDHAAAAFAEAVARGRRFAA